ncbi:MAG TPA: hypothetical protein PK603_06995, partial [Bacteroidales bacterium]|nr:hypothetical protein [Bacteroidales bacterium]
LYFCFLVTITGRCIHYRSLHSLLVAAFITGRRIRYWSLHPLLVATSVTGLLHPLQVAVPKERGIPPGCCAVASLRFTYRNNTTSTLTPGCCAVASLPLRNGAPPSSGARFPFSFGVSSLANSLLQSRCMQFDVLHSKSRAILFEMWCAKSFWRI